MNTLTSFGIRITVETYFQPEHSRPREQKFIYAYRITIENMSDVTVQLLRRHWMIYDGNGLMREVEGEGIIGKQPVLKPGESHQYISWTHLMTDIGCMKGTYLMQSLPDGKQFSVRIPRFVMVCPAKHN
jgi:ApaG protein